MRNFIFGAFFCLALTLGGLLLQSAPVAAGGNIDAKSTFGFVYGVESLEQWRKEMPAGGGENSQPGLDRQLLEKTHYVYESGGSEALSRLAFQRMLWQAQKDGWTIVETDEKTLSASMVHANISINEMALKPSKR